MTEREREREREKADRKLIGLKYQTETFGQPQRQSQSTADLGTENIYLLINKFLRPTVETAEEEEE